MQSIFYKMIKRIDIIQLSRLKIRLTYEIIWQYVKNEAIKYLNMSLQ